MYQVLMKKYAPLLGLLLAIPVLQAQQLTQPATAAANSSLPNPLAGPTTPQPADETVVEEIIVRVNNGIITLSDLHRSQDELKNQLSNPAVSGGDDAGKPKEQDLLRDLIDQQLLTQKGAELGISADTEVVKRLDEIRKQMHLDSMEAMEKAAQAQGVSFEDFKQNLKNQIITQRVISDEVGGHINITHEEIQQYYDQHKSEMERPEQVRLSEILVTTQTAPPVKTESGQTALPEAPSADVVAAAQAKADKIYEQLKGGATFADVAKKDSDGPTATLGGDLEYFKRGTLSKQLEDQVFTLNAGQFTQPVRTNQGFVILEVTEHQTAGIPPLKDVDDQIHQMLYMQRMQPALREYLTKLREEAYIDIKPGYVDTGASPNETKPVFTTASAADKEKVKKKKKFGVF